MSEINRVHQWNIVAGNEHKPDTELFCLYLDLIKEEYEELLSAEDREDHLDAAGDLYVVITGMLHSMGVNGEELLKRINDSNFSKFATTEEEAKKSVLRYMDDLRYENVSYKKVGGYYVIRGDKVNGGKNKILKSYKFKEPVLGDL